MLDGQRHAIASVDLDRIWHHRFFIADVLSAKNAHGAYNDLVAVAWALFSFDIVLVCYYVHESPFQVAPVFHTVGPDHTLSLLHHV